MNLIKWSSLLLLTLASIALTLGNSKTEIPICTDEITDSVLDSKYSKAVLITPDDTTLLEPNYGLRYGDLFIKNNDTLSQYYIHEDLIKTIQLVGNICKEVELNFKRKVRLHINSVVRSKAYNKKIGGVSDSEHLDPIGHAVDITFSYGRHNRYIIDKIYHDVKTQGLWFEALHRAGVRSYGFYPWGMHFGVRNRKHGKEYNGEKYAIWDNRK